MTEALVNVAPHTSELDSVAADVKDDVTMNRAVRAAKKSRKHDKRGKGKQGKGHKKNRKNDVETTVDNDMMTTEPNYMVTTEASDMATTVANDMMTTKGNVMADSEAPIYDSTSESTRQRSGDDGVTDDFLPCPPVC